MTFYGLGRIFSNLVTGANHHGFFFEPRETAGVLTVPFLARIFEV